MSKKNAYSGSFVLQQLNDELRFLSYPVLSKCTSARLLALEAENNGGLGINPMTSGNRDLRMSLSVELEVTNREDEMMQSVFVFGQLTG